MKNLSVLSFLVLSFFACRDDEILLGDEFTMKIHEEKFIVSEKGIIKISLNNFEDTRHPDCWFSTNHVTTDISITLENEDNLYLSPTLQHCLATGEAMSIPIDTTNLTVELLIATLVRKEIGEIIDPKKYKFTFALNNF